MAALQRKPYLKHFEVFTVVWAEDSILLGYYNAPLRCLQTWGTNYTV